MYVCVCICVCNSNHFFDGWIIGFEHCNCVCLKFNILGNSYANVSNSYFHSAKKKMSIILLSSHEIASFWVIKLRFLGVICIHTTYLYYSYKYTQSVHMFTSNWKLLYKIWCLWAFCYVQYDKIGRLNDAIDKTVRKSMCMMTWMHADLCMCVCVYAWK